MSKLTGKLTGWNLRAGFAICALALLAFAAPAGAACPNEALREAQGATGLPGCMALEMVSPPKKFSQPAFFPSFSRNGERLQLTVQTALAGTPGYQFYRGDRYVASRGASGWGVAPTAPRDPAIVAGGRWQGSAAAFTPDLDRWAQIGSTQAQFQVGVAQLFGGGLDGSFAPLSPLLVPIDDSGTEKTQQAVEDLEFIGASADLSASVLKVTLASTGYFPEDPRGTGAGEAGGDRNSYVAYLDEAGQPALQLLARDKDGKAWGGRCGAHMGGAGSSFNSGFISATFNQGALSPDGQRIFFTTRPDQPWNPAEEIEPVCDIENGLRILRRVTTAAGVTTMTEIAPGGGGAGAPGDDLFQAASADGTKVYFLSPRKLTAADTDTATGPCSGSLGASKGCDLYLFDSAEPPASAVTLASDAEGVSVEADVLLSTPAISGDGSHAYFVAQGVLNGDTNPEGDSALSGQPNLYLFEAATKELSFIATLASGDAAGMWDTEGTLFSGAYAVPVHGEGPEDGGDGHILAFASKAPLTGTDADGGFRDVFRYDADADTLELLSVPQVGEPEPADVFVNPAWFKGTEYNFGEATRWVSEDGQTIAFATAEALLPGDGDGALNPYVWNSGELGTVAAVIPNPSGNVRPPAVAPVGDQITFSTPTVLLPRDGDSAEDVYVARANGGFAEPVPPPVCQPLEAGACQGPPSPKPSSAPPPPTGPSGNVKGPRKCKKGQVRRKGKCVKKKQGKRKAGKRANRSQGGRS